MSDCESAAMNVRLKISFIGKGVKMMEELLKEIEILKIEYEKFARGNKSAGTRARKSLQTIKKLAQDLRIEIQNTKKTD
ncbi:MAG: hypothetical protein JW795_18575 [Chitinivibrionales bacterium]|nr:hypothetical protein [Chitinivibrionales bacterium]